jgi:protein-S-isoprenylcysteine O-methyltransferase Ste14
MNCKFEYSGESMRKKIFQYRGTLFVPAAILMLVLGKPTVTSIIIGLAISFLIGEGIRIFAVGYSGTTTRADQLKAPELVTAGPYAHVRNPLYLGNFISWIGFSVAAAGEAPLISQVIIYSFVIISNLVIYGIIIPLEEEYLESQYSDQYKDYKKSVPRLFPCLKAYDKQNGIYKPDVIAKAESQTIIMLIGVSVLIIVKYFYHM